MDGWMDSWMDLSNQIWRPPPPNLIAAFICAVSWTYCLFGRTDHHRPTDHYPPLNDHYPPLNNHCPLLNHHYPPLCTTIPPLFPPLTTTIHDQTPLYDHYTPLSTSQQIQNKSPVEVT